MAEQKVKVEEIAEAVKQALMNDPGFWDQVEARAGEGWFKRYKKADEDLEI